ncbi:MAG: hypothetical protein AAF253_12820 [Pseudomonadota bacterium]
MSQHYTTFDAPPPSPMPVKPLGHWAVLAVVFFSGPIFWAIGNGVEWALYNPSEGYQFANLVHPMTQDRIARYWPWAVRVTLGINVMLAFATLLLLRQGDAEREGQPHTEHTRSLENWLIKVTGTLATAVVVVFFWASAGAVGYLILKNLF